MPQILKAFAATMAYAPKARLILAGDSPDHARAQADVHRLGLDGHVIITGYLDSDAALTACIAACDATLNLRWPTAGELSGPWLRSLALGLPTVIVDLAHLADVPSLDPRTWQRHGGGSRRAARCASRSTSSTKTTRWRSRCAVWPRIRRSASRSGAPRLTTGAGNTRPSIMIERYRALLPEAMARPVPTVSLPAHLVDDGEPRARGDWRSSSGCNRLRGKA